MGPQGSSVSRRALLQAPVTAHISGSADGTITTASTTAASPHPQVAAPANRSRSGPSVPWAAALRLEAVFRGSSRNPGATDCCGRWASPYGSELEVYVVEAGAVSGRRVRVRPVCGLRLLVDLPQTLRQRIVDEPVGVAAKHQTA